MSDISISVYDENDSGISDLKLFETLKETLAGYGKPIKKVLILPPDYTRLHSGAGKITAMLVRLLRDEYDAAYDIMPALGTHEKVSEAESDEFFGVDSGIKHEDLIVHNWRNDVVKLGEVPGDFVAEVSEGTMTDPVEVEVNKRIVDKSYDLVISVGQVVPHEVVGMANHNKNIFVGCGGSSMISSSHMIGAFYGLERMMGKADTPVRKVFNYAEDNFLQDAPLLYVLTVTTANPAGPGIRLHGLFIGKDRALFTEAANLARKKNMITVDKPLKKVICYLDKKEFKTTWVGNKAIYRTRKAIADGGELVVLAPGAAKFGEDPENDRLIRKYGYVGRDRVLELYRSNDDLQQNKSVPAHLIHSSSDGRFKITYAVKKLTREEVNSVNFAYADYDLAAKRYDPSRLKPGFNTLPDGEEVYFVPNPALGLWVYEG